MLTGTYLDFEVVWLSPIEGCKRTNAGNTQSNEKEKHRFKVSPAGFLFLPIGQIFRICAQKMLFGL